MPRGFAMSGGMNIDFNSLSPLERYRLMIQTIVPRPIAWVLTRNEASNYNLAPFSYFNAIHSNPPLLLMSIGYKQDKSKKDTRSNIERDKKFVVHIASSEHAALVTRSSLPLPKGVSEVEDCNLETVCDWKNFDLPRLKRAKVAMACKLERVLEIGSNNQGLVFGEILEMHLADEILSGDGPTVDAKKLDPLGRLGGNDYGSLGEVLTVDRPEYKPG